MSTMINVLLVDDHVLVRTCIKSLLAHVPGIRVIGEAGNGEEAMRLVREEKPSVIIMDIMMPGISSVEVINRLRRIYPEIKIVILTAVDNQAFPKRLLDLGASGYLTKDSTSDELIEAIKKVARGGRHITNRIAQGMAISKIDPDVASPFNQLSNREFQIMMMIINGYKVDYISDKLCLSPKTISSHRYAIFSKLDVKNDVELTHFAIKHGIIDISAPETLVDAVIDVSKGSAAQEAPSVTVPEARIPEEA